MKKRVIIIAVAGVLVLSITGVAFALGAAGDAQKMKFRTMPMKVTTMISSLTTM